MGLDGLAEYLKQRLGLNATPVGDGLEIVLRAKSAETYDRPVERRYPSRVDWCTGKVDVVQEIEAEDGTKVGIGSGCEGRAVLIEKTDGGVKKTVALNLGSAEISTRFTGDGEVKIIIEEK